MKNNRKYIITICLLVIVIIIEPFVGIQFGNKMIVNSNYYKNIKSISDKYSHQDKIINDIKKQFLYKVDDKKLMEESLRGAIAGFDDIYTAYMSKEEYDEFLLSMNGLSSAGIGVMIYINDNHSIMVEHVFPNSSAEKVGIKKGDKIIKVDDKEINISSKESLEDVTKKIKGEAGTYVKISIMRQDEFKEFNVKRAETKIPNLISHQIDDIGYIKLIGFNVNCGNEFKQELEKLTQNNVSKLIIDLRDNPGGLLDEANKISGLFMPYDTVIAYTKNNKNIKTEIKTTNKSKPYNFSIVILVNENSASASELFSGMMKDYKKATIIGKTTFGKGLVQTINPLDDGSAVKISISEYFTPQNHKINKIGVKPDVDLSDEMQNQMLDLFPSADQVKEDVCFKKAVDIFNNSYQVEVSN